MATLSCEFANGDRMLRARTAHYSHPFSERSAARLAHQSGGLGIPSSNLGAPTKKTKKNRHFSRSRRSTSKRKKGTKKNKSPEIGALLPEQFPK